MENKNLFEQLYAIDVSKKTEKKSGLTYLSWAYAVSELSKLCSDFTYDIEPYTYDEKLGYMVYTHITINGITKRMWLPVMDYNNKAMKDHQYQWKDRYGKSHNVEPASMTDINKAYMRCLTKNVSMFGLGMYIYAGEDLPEQEGSEKVEKASLEQITFITNAYKDKLPKLLANLKIEKLEQLDSERANEIIAKIKEQIK